MTKLSKRRNLVVLTAGIAALLAAPSQAETVVCTEISSLPYMIDKPGAYCLQRSLGTALLAFGDAAIAVKASDVVLDLNGHAIFNEPALVSTQAFGVLVWPQAENVTIRNGTIRNYWRGIHLTGQGLGEPQPTGRTVERMTIDLVTNGGIFISGAESFVLRDNTITNVGNGVVDTTSPIFGIEVSNSGGVIVGNRVAGFLPAGKEKDAWFHGIEVAQQDGDQRAYLIADNHVDMRYPQLTGQVSVVQAIVVRFANAVVRGNSVANSDRGIQMSGPQIKYAGNLTVNTATPFLGGVDAGGNN